MKIFGRAIATIALLTGTALAQPALTPEQQASAPASAAFDDMLSAVQNSRQTAQRISSLGAVAEDRVELRDAYQLSLAGPPGQLDQTYASNRDAVQALRQALIANKSVDRALSREQVPIADVVAADLRPDGHVVVYAYPQVQVPPR